MNTPVVLKSLQDILDQTVDYLCSQRRPAVRRDGCCVYRTRDGNRDAVGFWIPDALYRRQWDPRDAEANTIRFLLQNTQEGPLVAAALLTNGIDVKAPYVLDLLTVLQDAHTLSSGDLTFHDDDHRRLKFASRPAFFDTCIPYLLRKTPIPGITYLPRCPPGN
jgi:hypothetical protein